MYPLVWRSPTSPLKGSFNISTIPKKVTIAELPGLYFSVSPCIPYLFPLSPGSVKPRSVTSCRSVSVTHPWFLGVLFVEFLPKNPGGFVFFFETALMGCCFDVSPSCCCPSLLPPNCEMQFGVGPVLVRDSQ